MLIYAHRGGAGEFPEGSLQAYLGAIKAGSDGFECDLRLTKDEQIICYHDSTTKRLSKLDLKIANCDLAQLKQQVELLSFVDLLE
ncbi:MAG: glycerophosphodiester phosphodiesterase, partial [Candidatus Nanopelagicus sp.]